MSEYRKKQTLDKSLEVCRNLRKIRENVADEIKTSYKFSRYVNAA